MCSHFLHCVYLILICLSVCVSISTAHLMQLKKICRFLVFCGSLQRGRVRGTQVMHGMWWGTAYSLNLFSRPHHLPRTCEESHHLIPFLMFSTLIFLPYFLVQWELLRELVKHVAFFSSLGNCSHSKESWTLPGHLPPKRSVWCCVLASKFHIFGYISSNLSSFCVYIEGRNGKWENIWKGLY